MKQTGKRIYDWFEQRLQVEGPIKDAVLHKVPRNTASWWYVFGSAAFTLLMLQIVTGILLALVYVPSAAEAWNSLNILNHQVPLGWFLRAVHGWGSNFMVAVVFIHMAQVFLFGAYKFPRELTWTVGVFLLLMTLGMAFTGQVLRFDQDAYWGLGIGVFILSRVPWMGGGLVHLLLGGPTIAGATLSRFFALHVFVIPGTLLFLALVHVWMVIKLGINEWPMPGRLVRKSTYIAEYNKLTHEDGIPFVPGAFWKDLIFSAAVLAAVGVCAAVFGPSGPGGQPDPSITQTVPKPDFPFLWIYAVLSYLPPSMETPFILIAPILMIAGLLAVPFVASEGEKSWHRRPVAVLALASVAVGWGVFTHLAMSTPWSPHMSAWSGDTLPVEYLREATPLVRQGAVIFQAKQCRNCHSIGGLGGERGPALDAVATRMTPDQMRYKVVTGGGNMPAYGKNLSPPEIEALVSFLETLHPKGEPPAFDASQQAAQSNAALRVEATRHERGGSLHHVGHSVGRHGSPRRDGDHLCAGMVTNSPHASRAVSPVAIVAFLGGVGAIFVAVASPLDTFSESLLFMHMAQHFVLMSIAPPLAVLGAPVVPMLRGLPRAVIRSAASPAVCNGPAASGWSISDAQARGLDRDECGLSRMAYSEGIRVRAGVGRLAQL